MLVTLKNHISKQVQKGTFLKQTVYLLNDEFTTNAAAPLASPRTSEPGPGTLTIVDTANKVSITGNSLKLAGVTGAGTDPRIYSAPIERIAGRALYFKFKNLGMRVGFAKNTTQGPNIAFRMHNDGNIYITNVGSVSDCAFNGSNVQYEALIIIKGNTVGRFGDGFQNGGYLYLIKGGAYTDWTLVGTSDYYDSDEPLYFIVSCYNLNVDNQFIDDIKIVDLGGAYSHHFPLSVTKPSYPYAVANNSVYVNEANGIISFQYKSATGNSFDTMVRRVDDDNCWIIRIAQSGTIKIIEKIAGVETEKASGAQTIINNGNYSIRINLNGSVIKVYVNGNAIVTYSTASTLLTEVGGKITGTFAGIIKYTFYKLTHPTIEIKTGNTPKHIFCYGDSKTFGSGDSTPPVTGSGGYEPILMELLDSAYPYGWYEKPLRVGIGGIDTATAKTQIDTKLAAAIGTPNYVCYNLGANDNTFDATWITNTGYILDAIHTKWPSAKIYCAVIWTRTGGATKTLAQKTALLTALSTRGSFAFLGIDESIVLEGGDDGVTNTADGIHPNRIGYRATANAWKIVMGL